MYSIRSPGWISFSSSNETPAELMSVVSPLRATVKLPIWVISIGSRSLYRCARLWSKPQIYATKITMAMGNGT